MNGAVIPALLWFVVSFHPEVPNEPIQLYGPLSQEECQAYDAVNSDEYTWCQDFKIKPPPKVKK